MGRMLYDCGAVDERVMRKFRQESEQIGKGSFALAWVLDQTDEERTRWESAHSLGFARADLCQRGYD